MCSARMPFANLSPDITVPSWVEEISMSTLHSLHPPAIKSGFRKGNKKPPLFSRAAHSHRVLTHHLHKNPSPLWYKVHATATDAQPSLQESTLPSREMLNTAPPPHDIVRTE